MGGSFDYREYTFDKFGETLDKVIVEQLYLEDQNQSAYDHGHSYSGVIGVMPPGIKWLSEKFKTFDDAYKHIIKVHNKWDRAMGAEIIGGGYFVGGWCSS